VRSNARHSQAPRRGNLCVVAVTSNDLDSGVRDFQAVKDAVNTSTPSVSVVPGTEIMPSSAPQIPAAPTQGMDFVLEQIKAKQAAMPPAPSTPAPSLPKVDIQLPKVDMARVFEQVQAKQAEFKNGTGSVGLPKNLPKLDVPKIEVPNIEFPTKDLTDGAAAAASKASAAAAEAAGAVSSVVGENAKQAAAAVSSAASDISEQVGGVVSSTQSIVQQAQTAAVGATSSLVGSVESQVASAVGTLPPPLRDALTAAASAAGDAAQFIAAEPRLGGAAVAASVAVPAVLLWNAAFGGYSGKYTATKALEILKSSDTAALLVDIRSERQRVDNGVPELKRGARGKGVALPASKLLPSIARKVRNADSLAIEILGAQIASLARVSGNTRVIIMDDRGEMAKAVARATRAAGVRRAYIVDGGFKAWKASGLAIIEKASEYDANPLALVGDAAETVAEEAAQLLKQPTNAVWVGAGITLAAFAAINYHLLFRYIGVIGIEATIALRVIDYESPQDALDDLNALLATVVGAAQVPLQLVEKITSSLPQQQQALPQQGSSAEEALQESSQSQ
jgi:rhodanese-related sulfurtransferase